MFADNVFSIPDLTPQRLFQLDIRPECNALEVPIKEEIADLCVFRRYEQTATQCRISKERLSYSVLKTHMKDVGEIAGFRDITRSYNLRYGLSNAFDNDGTCSIRAADVSRKRLTRLWYR